MNDFIDIHGHDKVKNLLKSVLKANRVSQTYIFTGEDGIGVGLIAKAFAKKIICVSDKKDGCLCSSCKVFDSNNHPDVIYVKANGSTISVDEIREVNKSVSIKPYKYDYKIFIIENADKLTPSAQNALLKTIEDGPKYAIFILISNNYNLLLDTVLSRGVVIKLRPLKPQEVKVYLQCNNINNDFAVASSGGNIKKAIRIATDIDFNNLRKDIINIIGLPSIDIIRLLTPYKDNFSDCIDIIESYFRDFIMHKYGSEIINNDKIMEIERFSKTYNEAYLYSVLNKLLITRSFLKNNANFNMVLCDLALSIENVE